MSRQQGPRPPQAPPPHQPQQQWRPQGDDHSARGLPAAHQGWQQPQPHAPPPQQPQPQLQPHYAAPPPPQQQPAAYGYQGQGQYQPAPQLQQTLPPHHTAPPQNAYAGGQHREPTRELGGLETYGVQVGQPAHAPSPQPPRTAPPGPRFADLAERPRAASFAPPAAAAPQPGPAYRPDQRQDARQDPRQDPAGYDLGGYAVPPSGPPGRFAAPPEQPNQWAREAAAYPAPQPHFPAAQAFATDYGQPHGQHGFGNVPAEQHAAHEHDEVEFEDEPRRSRRWLIAAALVCSIGIGGGMAYAYKTMFGPKAGTQTAVVKAAREPAKVAPDTPGGKRFPNADNKFMNRLDGDTGAQAGDVDANGVKRVQTVQVGPDRGIVAAQPGASSGPPRAVPGMTIVGADSMAPLATSAMLPGAGPTGMPPSRTVAQPAPAAGGMARPPAAPQAAAPPRQQVAARAAPQGVGAFDAEPAAAPAAKQPVPRVAAAAAVAAKPKTGGYVAVLGYQRNQLDAMKMLADLQQKYDVLRDKKLEVVESDQSARGLGTIYRIVVGPSTGIDAAKSVCTQVVQAGHPAKDCYTLGN